MGGHEKEVDCALHLSQVALDLTGWGQVRGGNLAGKRAGTEPWAL